MKGIRTGGITDILETTTLRKTHSLPERPGEGWQQCSWTSGQSPTPDFMRSPPSHPPRWLRWALPAKSSQQPPTSPSPF